MSDMGRATRNIVSGYNRDRVFQARLYAPERRALVTDFNGALPNGVTIVRATWKTLDTTIAAMSSPSILEGERSAQVMVQAQYDGFCCIRLDALLSNGEQFVAHHVLHILPARYLNNDTWFNGPCELVAEPAPEPIP